MVRVLGFMAGSGQGRYVIILPAASGLADRVPNPMRPPGGALVGGPGIWIGVGLGCGITALCILIGLVKAAAALRVSLSPVGSAFNQS
jgi:hypothetical protein